MRNADFNSAFRIPHSEFKNQTLPLCFNKLNGNASDDSTRIRTQKYHHS